MTENHFPVRSIAVIGSGNVGSHLSAALLRYCAGCEIVSVNPRSLLEFPEKCDLAIISVADRAIGEVARKISGKAEVIAHTSGSVPMEILNGCAPHYGVFYPLQTFTKGVVMDYSEIPFFIEGSDAYTLSLLRNMANQISEAVYEADSSTRKKLHLASVFACNFTNHLVGIADEILSDEDFDYKVLIPLLRQTVGKLSDLSPQEAQTGPAVRGDVPVLEAHLEMLDDRPPLKEIYRMLSSRIMQQNISH